MNAQNNSDVLVLNSETSLVLPSFDTTSIANSNIDVIILSLYVVDKVPGKNSQTQITINPVDLNTNIVEDGVSTFVDVIKGSYIDFRLPRELFEQAIHTQKRFLVRLVNNDQRIILQGPNSAGTTQDPMLIVQHSDLEEYDVPDMPQIIENNYFTIENAQLHFGEGDNVGNDKIETRDTQSSDIPLWMKMAVALTTILGVIWGIYTHFSSKNSVLNQNHSGQGDNIAGDKIINKQGVQDASLK